MDKKVGILIAIVVVIIAAVLAVWLASTPPPTTTPKPAAPSPTTITTQPTTTPTPTVSRITIATGGIGGVYYYYGSVIASILNNYTDIRANAIQTAASIDNLLLIRDRGVEYCATTLPDSAYLAYTSQHPKFANKTAPIAILWAMYPNYLHIVTKASTGIKTIYDLKGKRVSTGAPGSGTEVNALSVLQLVGIDPAKDFAKWEKLGAQESAKALADGTIDAFFWSGGLPTGSIVELSALLKQRGDQIVLISIPDDVIKAYAEKYPGVAARGVIPASVYGAPQDAVTLAYWNFFVCHKDLPADVAYKITKAVFEHLDILHKSVAAAKDTNLQNALIALGGEIPYHPGALKYFCEVGLQQACQALSK